MRRLILTICLMMTGCGGASFFLNFSPSYDARTTLVNTLPTVAMRPGETKRVMASSPEFPWSRAMRLVSEDPRVVIVWNPPRPGDVVRIQAAGIGTALVHRGDYPFEEWREGKNPVERARWRAALRKYLSPRPDEAAFRAFSDEVLWRTLVRSRSQGAMRVTVDEDRTPFWRAAE